MPRQEAPFFARGRTLADGTTIDASSLEKSANIVGKEWEIEDIHPDTGVRRINTASATDPGYNHNLVKVRACRNRSGQTLLGKTLVILDPSDPGSIIGVATGADPGIQTWGSTIRPIDEYLPSAGCPDNDVCLVVIEGQAVAKTPTEASVATTIWSAGQWLVAATGAATTQELTGTTSEGRLASLTMDIGTGTNSVADNVNATKLANRLGVAMTACATTGVTNTDILVNFKSLL